MINLKPLRATQTIDVSFQLLRYKFTKTFLLSVLVVIPTQFLVWIFRAFENVNTSSELNGRLTLVIWLLQFFSIGFSLALSSNLLSKIAGSVYCKYILQNNSSVKYSPSQLAIALLHVGIQVGFLALMLCIRFLFGRAFIDNQANLFTTAVFLVIAPIWICVTLYLSLSTPITTHEGGSFSDIQKRAFQVSKKCFFRLFGITCLFFVLITILISPTISILEMIFPNQLLDTYIASITYETTISTALIAGACVAYGYILQIVYFNTRIEYEGFDIELGIRELENEGNTSGELLKPVAR